jgi:hypothetical protein
MQFERGKLPKTPNAPYREPCAKDRRLRSEGLGYHAVIANRQTLYMPMHLRRNPVTVNHTSPCAVNDVVYMAPFSRLTLQMGCKASFSTPCAGLVRPHSKESVSEDTTLSL